MLVSTKKLLIAAQKSGYAVGAFNIDNLEMLQAVVRAAHTCASPAIIAVSESSLAYAGAAVVRAMVDVITKGKIPFALHIDHGKDIALIKKCIDLGWTSVMYDGSLLPYEENVKHTKAVVAYARPKGVSVEAELGALKIQEDGDGTAKNSFTDPRQAAAFVRTTRIDCLAIAIGTSHGAFKAKTAVTLDFERLKKIRQVVSIPLVLHGASSLSQSLQKKMHQTCESLHDCLRLEGAHGVPSSILKKCIHYGISKINVGTDLRAAFVAGMRSSLLEHTMSYDEREMLADARALIEKTVAERMTLFGSAGKATKL